MSISSSGSGVEGGPPPLLLEASRVCLFCYKVVISSDEEEEDVGRFLTLLERFVGEEIAMLEKFCGGRETKGIGCCGDCGLIVSSFCEAYHQLKCLEIRLEWKLGTMVNIMRFANRVPSRLEGLKRVILEEAGNPGEVLELRDQKISNFKAMRTKLIRTCSRKLVRSQPRVRLERISKDRRLKASSSSTSALVPSATSVVASASNEMTPPVPVPLAAGSLLGWTIYLPALPIPSSSLSNNLELPPQPEKELFPHDDLDEDDRPPSPDVDGTSEDFIEDSPGIVTVPSSTDLGEPCVTVGTKSLQGAPVPPNDAGLGNLDMFTQPALRDTSESSCHSHNSSIHVMDGDNNGVQLKSEIEDIVTSTPAEEEGSSPNYSSTSRKSLTDVEPLPSQNERMRENTSSPQYSGIPDNSLIGSRTTLESISPHETKAEKDTLNDTEDVLASKPGTSGISQNLGYNLRQKRKRSFSELEEETDPQNGDDYQVSDVSSSSSSDTDDSSGTDEEEITDDDKPRKNGRSAGTFKHCDICQRDISEKKYERHWKHLHDTTDVNSKEIVRCPVEGCPAFFVNRGDGDYLYENVSKHNQQVHKELLEEFAKKKAAEEKRDKEEPQYNCELCKKPFKTKGDFDGHQKLHGSFKCEFCEVVKEYAPDLAFHELEEHTIREEIRKGRKRDPPAFPCSRCPFNCSIRSKFVSHFVSAHLNVDSTGKDFSCSVCQAGFTKPRGLERHFQLFHKTAGRDEPELFRCDLCPAYFLQGRQLQAHKLVVHLKKKCPVCGKSFTNHRGLKTHLEGKHPEFRLLSESTFICDIGKCRRQFPSKAALERHRKHKDHDVQKTVKCDICEKEFQRKQKLSVHKSHVHKEASMMCSECGKAFNRKDKLKKHMLYHQGPEAWKFQCSTCGRKFADKWKLEAHSRTHTKEKPFICQYCGEKYAHRHNWRNHVKTKHPEEFEEGGCG